MRLASQIPGTLGLRTRCVGILLVLMAVWPLAHRGLVARHDLNPWRFFGWAMYCVPIFEPDFEMHSVDNSGQRSQLDYPDRDPYYDLIRGRYLLRRRDLGQLARPDDLAWAALVEYPKVTHLIVVVSQLQFDLGSKRLVIRTQEYEYRVPPRQPQPSTTGIPGGEVTRPSSPT